VDEEEETCSLINAEGETREDVSLTADRGIASESRRQIREDFEEDKVVAVKLMEALGEEAVFFVASTVDC